MLSRVSTPRPRRCSGYALVGVPLPCRSFVLLIAASLGLWAVGCWLWNAVVSDLDLAFVSGRPAVRTRRILPRSCREAQPFAWQPRAVGRSAGATANVAEVVDADSASESLEYVLPIGPACPKRSAEMLEGDLDGELALLMHRARYGAEQFAPLAASFAAGISPDPRRARRVADEMSRQAGELKDLLDKLENSDDFQAIESYFTLEATAAHMKTPSMRAVEKIVNWQASGLIAYTQGKPLDPAPPEVVAAQQRQPIEAMPGVPLPSGSSFVPMWPLTEEDFDAAPDEKAAREVQQDYEKLVYEHEQLVGAGETYRKFDYDGKTEYLEKLESIIRRWELMLQAAERIGVRPSDVYKTSSREYLQRVGLTGVGFRDLILGVHRRIRGFAALDFAKASSR